MVREMLEPIITNFIAACHKKYDFSYAVVQLASLSCEEALG
jgi:hypothetical protein